MLMTMIIYWTVHTHSVIYPSMDPGQTIAYISDVGAFRLNPLFEAMGITTVWTLNLGMLAERWLRHNGRLAPNTTRFQKILDIVALLCAIAGAVGLTLLTIYNTNDYPNMHDRCLGVFLVGYVLSAIFICWEYQRLGAKFVRHPILAASFWIKLFFILIEIALAIGMFLLPFPRLPFLKVWKVIFGERRSLTSAQAGASQKTRTRSTHPQSSNGSSPSSSLATSFPSSWICYPPFAQSTTCPIQQ